MPVMMMMMTMMKETRHSIFDIPTLTRVSGMERVRTNGAYILLDTSSFPRFFVCLGFGFGFVRDGARTRWGGREGAPGSLDHLSWCCWERSLKHCKGLEFEDYKHGAALEMRGEMMDLDWVRAERGHVSIEATSSRL